MNIHQMPKLQPVPIKTKDKTPWKAFWTWINSRRKWEFVEDWTFKATIDNDEYVIVIEKGYEFDGASVPRIFWWLFNPIGLLLIPSVFHDYCYTHGFLVLNRAGKKERLIVDRNFSDLTFKEVGIQVNGLSWIFKFIWGCLHLFAGIAWWNCRHSRESYFGE